MMISQKNIASFFILTSLIAPTFSYAANVSFEQTPLFKSANFSPGEKVSRFFIVTNAGPKTKDVVAQTTNAVCDSQNCFAKKMRVTVVSDTKIYFDGTLFGLFQAGEISLGSLESGANRRYDMNITFEPGPNDDLYQSQSVNFDLTVGTKEKEGLNANGGGAVPFLGVSVPVAELHISNEQARVQNIENESVLITWNTNYDAYGHVIYGVDTGTAYTLDLSKPNFGYPMSAPSDPSDPKHIELPQKTTFHSIVLAGLAPGKTYRYRAVSHASPPTVGYEYTFTVPRETEPPYQNKNIIMAETATIRDSAKGTASTTKSDVIPKSSKPISQVAGVFGARPEAHILGWIFAHQKIATMGTLLLAALCLIFWKRRKKKSEN